MKKTLIKNYCDFCGWLKENKQPVMGFDTETTSLSYLKMDCIGFSLATNRAACYVIPERPENLIDYFMQLKGITLVIHNAVFDLKVLYKYGYEPERIFCTLTGMKLCDENRWAYDLKTLAEEILKVPSSQIKKYDEVCDNTDSPIFVDYAMNDAIWAYQLWEYEKVIIHRENLTYLAEEVEMPFQFVLRDLEVNGILVDRTKLNHFKTEVKQILISIEKEMLELIGKKHQINTNLFGEIEYVSPINFNADQTIIKIIENFGVEIWERTKPSEKYPDGQKSLAAVTKKRIKNKHPFIDLYLRRCKLDTLYRNFILKAENFLDLDGRIRTSYGLKITGRLSSSEPPLQQLPNPKKEKLEFNHRELFIPKEGNVLVCADWSGQELRNLAECSNDKNMVQAFNDDYDLHLFTANRVFNLALVSKEFINSTPEHELAVKKHKAKRHQAKNGVNFPTVYGAFAQRIAADNNVSIEEAQRWLDEFDNLYPGVKKWKESVFEKIRRKGYTSTLMGRRRRFPHYHQSGRWEKAKMERQAANFEIQGFSADQMKIAAVKIRQFLVKYKALYVLIVHDELIWEVPIKYAKKFAEEVKYVMEHAVSMKVPSVVDITIKKNYGE